MDVTDDTLRALAQRLRRDSVLSTTEAGSGHPTTCMSAAELVAVLFGRELAIDPKDASRLGTDHFVLSKGHAAPVLWAALKEIGAIAHDTMTLRRADSPLEGHPTLKVPGWVRIASGSLGQGLCASMGMARARRLAKDPGRIYCLMGDGEIAEGSVWEAAQLAAHDKLDNLCGIVDVNALGQSGRTMHQHDLDAIAAKWRAFGWHAICLDGHDVVAISKAFAEARATTGRPTVVLARTLKGKGSRLTEDKDGWHGRALKKGPELDGALAEIGDPKLELTVTARTRGPAPARPVKPTTPPPAPPYKLGDEVATREAYGEALVRLGTVDLRIVALDAETKNSTFAEKFKDKFPDRFVECFIAEQNMIGAALGFSAEGYVPFASSFAAFLTRAYDFIRMAACSSVAHLVVVGSHVGVSIGEDGASQMGLEDVAMVRALVDSTVLYPSDAMCASRLIERAAETDGLVYVRMSRPKTKVIYGPDEQFPIGGSKLHGAKAGDRATIIGGGVTFYEALAAQATLAAKGIPVRVVDLYSIKPLDVATLERCAQETGAFVTVEDHSPAGGLGEAVAGAIRVPRLAMLAVRTLPRSAKPTELLAMHEIDAAAIVKAVERLIG